VQNKPMLQAIIFRSPCSLTATQCTDSKVDEGGMLRLHEHSASAPLQLWYTKCWIPTRAGSSQPIKTESMSSLSKSRRIRRVTWPSQV